MSASDLMVRVRMIVSVRKLTVRVSVIVRLRELRVRVRESVGVRVLLMKLRVEFRRRDPAAEHARGRHLAQFGGQAAERGTQVVDWQPEVEQRAEDHVARGAGETIEVERLCQPSTPSVLAEAVVLHVREDHVIEHVYPHQDASGREPFGQPHVIVARLGIA